MMNRSADFIQESSQEHRRLQRLIQLEVRRYVGRATVDIAFANVNTGLTLKVYIYQDDANIVWFKNIGAQVFVSDEDERYMLVKGYIPQDVQNWKDLCTYTTQNFDHSEAVITKVKEMLKAIGFNDLPR